VESTRCDPQFPRREGRSGYLGRAVVPADIGWSDVGNWGAVWQLSERDGNGNSIRGRGVVMNASNVHVRSDEHLTTVVGVDDVIVVTTQEALSRRFGLAVPLAVL
jgi:mannose-1-phosphate guanylyltransferase